MTNNIYEIIFPKFVLGAYFFSKKNKANVIGILF